MTTSDACVGMLVCLKKNYVLNSSYVTFNVTAKSLSDVTVTPIADQVVTGEQIKPAITVMNGSVKLVEGKDYEVSYGENKEVGEGTVTIKATVTIKDGSKKTVYTKVTVK